MRTYHPINWVHEIQWHEIITDRRFWGGVAIVVFIALLTAIVIIGAQAGVNAPITPYGPGPYGPGWPYGPYGPMPVP